MTNDERKYKIFKIFFNNSANKETLEELEQSIKRFKFIDRNTYSMMKDAKVANYMYFKIKENRDTYSEIMYNYNIILQSISNLAKELNLEDSLELCILFSYLLWYGYLSKKREYKFNSNNPKRIPGLFFADIMDGSGVCLNNSEMLKDFLNLNEYNSVMLQNHYNSYARVDCKIDIITVNGEEKQKNIKELMSKIYKLRKPNHVFNLIEDNDKLYIYDSTNLLLQSMINPYKSRLINGNGKYRLYPYKSYMLCASFDEIQLIDKVITNSNYSLPYKKSDLIATNEVIMEILTYNKKLLEDFYTEIKPNILEISSEINKVKTLIK